MPAPRTPGDDSEAVASEVVPTASIEAMFPEDVMVYSTDVDGMAVIIIHASTEAGEETAIALDPTAARSVGIAMIEAVATLTPQPPRPTRAVLRMGGANRNLTLGGRALVTAMFGPVGDDLVAHVTETHGVPAAVAHAMGYDQVRTLHESFRHHEGDH